MERKEINDLIEKVKVAADVYYQGSTAVMTDEEYDNAVEYLQELVESGELKLTDELNEILYTSVSAGTKSKGITVKHDFPMLSLGKAKDEKKLRSYHTKLVKEGATGFRLDMKLDGLAISAKYKDGELVSLATRGDGYEGESRTYLASLSELKIKGLPIKNVENKDEFEIRGEIYITNSQFEDVKAAREKATGEIFSNSRNAVSGLIKSAETKLGYNAEISFNAYSAYKDGVQINFEDLGVIKELTTVIESTENELKLRSTDEVSMKSAVVNSTKVEDLISAVETFGKLRESFGIPTDGVVIKPINEIEMNQKLGFNSHHPVSQIAYKYPGAKGTSEILDLTISVGKTGRLTPKAIIKPVEIDGVVINKATCHNFSWMKSMGLRIGSTVTIKRANDVIPAIDSVILEGSGKLLEPPKNCPVCGGLIVGQGEADKVTGVHKTLSCSNEACESRLLFYIKSAVGRQLLDIDGLGDVALESLVDNGTFKTICDIYRVTEDELAKTKTGLTSTGNVRKLGAGNAKNIIESINKSRTGTDEYKILAVLNMPEFGKSNSKKVLNKFGSIDKFLSQSPEEIEKLDGFGREAVESFKKNKEKALKTYKELLSLGVVPLKKAKSSTEIKGSFSVSGSVEGFNNRDEFVEYMEKEGWEFHKSPKKDTTILFADPESTSSKVVKAKKNGTRVVKNISDL